MPREHEGGLGRGLLRRGAWWLAAGEGAALSMAGCGGNSSNGCPTLAGSYAVTTEIVSVSGCTAVKSGTLTRNVTYTFTQTTPSCTAAKVTWDSETPALAFTYTGEDLTLTPASGSAGATLRESFTWTTGSCQGTTNVCTGDVTDCSTPH